MSSSLQLTCIYYSTYYPNPIGLQSTTTLRQCFTRQLAIKYPKTPLTNMYTEEELINYNSNAVCLPVLSFQKVGDD
jgi:hypothetical protein